MVQVGSRFTILSSDSGSNILSWTNNGDRENFVVGNLISKMV